LGLFVIYDENEVLWIRSLPIFAVKWVGCQSIINLVAALAWTYLIFKFAWAGLRTQDLFILSLITFTLPLRHNDTPLFKSVPVLHFNWLLDLV